MQKKIIAIILIITSFFYSSLSFAIGRHDQTSAAKPIEKVQISQEEYDKKLAEAKDNITDGAIMLGVGTALFTGGLIMTIYGIRGLPGKAWLLVFGGLVEAGGAATDVVGAIALTKGLVSKNSVKKKYYTVSPVVNPNLYGLSFAVKF